MSAVEVYEPAGQVVPMREQIQALKNLVAKDCTDAELELFSKVCDRSGLDPFARQIYAIKRSGKLSIQTSIDGFRLIADRACRTRGWMRSEEPTVWCAADGQWTPDWLVNDAPVAARYTVLVSQPDGTSAKFQGTARFAAYRQDSPVWKSMPEHMLAKCAEALALRKAFPQELSGLYTADEMGHDVAPDIPIPPKKAVLMTETVEAAGVSIAQVVSLASNGRTEDPAELWQSQVAAAAEVFEELKLQVAESQEPTTSPTLPQEPPEAETATEGADEAQKPTGTFAAEPPEKPTDAKMRKLSALLREGGYLAEQRHIFASSVLGRPVSSLTDLSKSDASKCIDALAKETVG